LKLLQVGIVGAGQLGRMMALAGYPLGIRCTFLDQSANSPGAQVAPTLLGPLEDAALLRELASQSDVLTFDWENISGGALAPLEKLTAIRPPRAALEISQDRLHEKALFKRLKIPVAEHAAVDTHEDLARAMKKLGAGILKTRRLGYDGKGQCAIERLEDVDGAWQVMGGQGLIYEKFQRFSLEVSLIAARSVAGDIVHYPLSANSHAGGILRYSRAPYANAGLERTARTYLKRVMRALDYVGVLTVEFFVVNGRLIANEMAPRVHNSGHWTIEGCVTSQFANHLRAICGLPLGSTRPLGHAAMVNFLGHMPSRERLLTIEGLAFHSYGKEPRPGRKLGHCTILRSRPGDRDRALKNALKSITWS
jgi:5-(carboxyamino)imidazole ribonucleotide synthase